MRTLLLAAGLLFGAPLSFFASPAALPGDDAVAVEVNGVRFTLADVEQKHPAAMFQARSNYYQLARKVLEDHVDEYLLAEEAKKAKLTTAELLEKHVNSAIAKDPGEDTLRVYYEMLDTTEPYEAVRPKIIDAVRQKRIAKVKAAYMESLRSRATIAYRLPAPRAPIASDQIVARGPAGAKVTLTEYADYECPYCQQIQPTLAKLEAEFKDKVAFVYKDFPLPMHSNAQKAAEASRCAQAQGKYWEYHDLLSSTKQLDLPGLKAHARQLGLNIPAFDKCLDGGEMAEAVKAQAAEAQALGIQGTPTFFINGRYISGSLSYERLRAVILEELSAADAQRSASARAGAGAQ